MYDELNEFERHEVWNLVPRLGNKTINYTLWLLCNNMDEEEIVIIFNA